MRSTANLLAAHLQEEGTHSYLAPSVKYIFVNWCRECVTAYVVISLLFCAMLAGHERDQGHAQSWIPSKPRQPSGLVCGPHRQHHLLGHGLLRRGHAVRPAEGASLRWCCLSIRAQSCTRRRARSWTVRLERAPQGAPLCQCCSSMPVQVCVKACLSTLQDAHTHAHTQHAHVHTLAPLHAPVL